MSRDNINWVAEMVAIVARQEQVKKISPVDDHANEIMAMKGCGFSWNKTAEEVNRILSLKAPETLNGKKLSRIATKWKSLGWIDDSKLGNINEEVNRAIHEQSSEVFPLESHEQATVLAQDNGVEQSTEQSSNEVTDTFFRLKDFGKELVKIFPDNQNNRDVILRVFEESKGKTKAEFIEAYRNARLEAAPNEASGE